MTARRRLLLVTYYFPPSGGSGVQRPLKFVKYLPGFGWDPVVLTVRETAAFPARDEALKGDVPEGIEVHRTPIPEPHRLFARLSGAAAGETVDVDTAARWDRLGPRARLLAKLRGAFFLPDARVGWWPFAAAKALSLHGRKPFDAVLTTAPPFTTHLIGRFLSRSWRRPWIADSRDPWTRAPFYAPRPRPSAALDRWIEGVCLRAADANVVAFPAIAREFLEDHPDLDPDRIEVITNGYDPDDFAGPAPPREERFTIVHSGSLFANRRPETFFRILGERIADLPSLAEKIRLVFVGRLDGDTRRLLGRPPFDRIADLRGYATHGESIAWIRRGHLLLLPIGAGPEAFGHLPGKLFEYLASGTPLLVTAAPDGAAARVVEETGSGWTLHPDDAEGLRSLLESAWSAHSGGRILETPRKEGAISLYSRKSLTGRLAEILNRAVETRGRTPSP